MADDSSTSKQPRDLTSSIHTDEEDALQADPVYLRTRKRVIRIGTVFFVLVGFVIFVPMVIGVARGISSGQIWDPYTGEPIVAAKEDASTCVEDARRLLVAAGEHEKLVRVWAEPYREWQMRCRKDHPDLYEALQNTREHLRTQKKVQ